VTESPSEAPARRDAGAIATRFAEMVGGAAVPNEHGTPKVAVPADRWAEAHRTLSEHLPFFSWLSAVDWSAEVAVGDPPAAEDVTEHYEIVSCLAAPDDVGTVLLVSTEVAKDGSVDSLTGIYAGASWHEREAAEMFGIEFTGHPHLVRLYLPDGFEGNPLRKSFPLLSREVKPWPGEVDVEDLPSTENREAGG
jgi:NADH-quinone oxidoreductase subunit C